MADTATRPLKVFGVDTEYKFSTELLSQFCGARTEPYTAHVSNVMCRDLKVSTKGQRNINNALNNLPIYTTPDERLTFGWATENLVRSRMMQTGAYEHLASMVALSECFHETFAALVMFEMAEMKQGSEDITPHFRQWKYAMRSVNGAFATTNLGLVVEDFIRMDPFNVFYDPNDEIRSLPINPKLLADAYLALEKVTSGQAKQLTVVGSAVISWLAAVSEWLYDLRIAVFSTKGDQLYVSHPGQETQVLFVFDEKLGIRVSDKPWTHDETQACGIAPSQVVVPYSTVIHSTPISGRVVWNSLLPRVFGHNFHRLDHEESSVFAQTLGAAARIFQALAFGEDSNGNHDQENFPDFGSAQNKSNTASYGIGLVQTLFNWLPELRRIQGKMERQLKLTPKEAGKMYDESIIHLAKLCSCGICKPVGVRGRGKNQNQSINPVATQEHPTLPKEEEEEGGKVPAGQHGYCLPKLTETIIALGLRLSRITVASGLYPSRAGIQALYNSQAAKGNPASHTTSAKGTEETFALIYGDEWNAPDTRRLSNIIQIFVGSRPRKFLPDNLVAIAHEGLCAYFVALEKPGSYWNSGGGGVAGRAETPLVKDDGVKLIRVVSGAINVRYKVFHRCTWGNVQGGGEEVLDLDDPWERVDVAHLDGPLYFRS
ncbi:hypothetical protein DV736_g1867, partial [Chaetothyriales sp. CBS 134916]